MDVDDDDTLLVVRDSPTPDDEERPNMLEPGLGRTTRTSATGARANTPAPDSPAPTQDLSFATPGIIDSSGADMNVSDTPYPIRLSGRPLPEPPDWSAQLMDVRDQL
jgi:hypothetical protein